MNKLTYHFRRLGLVLGGRVRKHELFMSLGRNCEVAYRYSRRWGFCESAIFQWGGFFTLRELVYGLEHWDLVYTGEVLGPNPTYHCANTKMNAHGKAPVSAWAGGITDANRAAMEADRADMVGRVAHLKVKFVEKLRAGGSLLVYKMRPECWFAEDCEEMMRRLYAALLKFGAKDFDLVYVLEDKCRTKKVSLDGMPRTFVRYVAAFNPDDHAAEDLGDRLGWRLIFDEFAPRVIKEQKHKFKFECDGRELLVIRLDNRGAGLFALWGLAVGAMKWAYDHGMVPYVDFQNGDNCFNRGKAIAYNPWECFFEQACSPTDFSGARNVWIAEKWVFGLGWPRCEPKLVREDNSEFLAWREFAQAHIRVRPDILTAVDERQRALFGDSRVLGCLVRGTDYTRMKPKMHPVQPEPQQVIADARRACDERGYEKIFLATEDRSVRALFREAFGDRLITSQDCLPDYTDGFLMRSGAVGDEARTLEMSRQYLVSILLLSRCQGLLAGCASGTVGALLFSHGYEWSHVYDLGFYRER